MQNYNKQFNYARGNLLIIRLLKSNYFDYQQNRIRKKMNELKFFLHNGVCPIRDILCRLGDKWSLLTLTTLSANGTMRFNEIQKSIGDISQRMLSVTLRSLEENGLTNRKIYPEVPPKVEYSLTKSGEDLIIHLNNLIDWALKNGHEIIKTRNSYSSKC
jgi:DNA-binding HxlR family transcriptional regulator